MTTIKIKNSEDSSFKEYPINVVRSLLTNLNILEVPIRSVCGGRGNCGTCRVKVLKGRQRMTKLTQQERHHLSQEQIKDGWRLSCQVYCLDGCVIEVPPVPAE